jgi:hypothetical protein
VATTHSSLRTPVRGIVGGGRTVFVRLPGVGGGGGRQGLLDVAVQGRCLGVFGVGAGEDRDLPPT